MDIGNARNVQFYPGRCEDCAKKESALWACSLVPSGPSARLCKACVEIRREECSRRVELREVGLTPVGKRSKWVHLPNLLLCVPEGDEVLGIKVKVIYRQPTVADLTPEDGGEIKLQIGEDNRWLWADFIDPGIFGFDPGRAMKNAQMALQAMMTEHRIQFTKVSLA